MKTENVYCDYCKKKTTDSGKLIHRINGFTATLGYSIGGWGTRRDFIKDHTVEICDDCFSEIEKVCENLVQDIKLLKRSKKP